MRVWSESSPEVKVFAEDTSDSGVSLCHEVSVLL